MNNILGIILTGGNSNNLGELSINRSSAAMPIGGKYRAIDFVLSNMVNSGVVSVGVITQYNFRSLMDHLGSGKEWDLDRRTKGLFIFPPFISPESNSWYRGSADALYNNLSFLRRSDEEYAIIAQGGNCIYKMDYTDMFDFHMQKDADITIVYREMTDFEPDDLKRLGIIQKDSDERLTDFQEKPLHPLSNNASIGIYIMKKSLLISLLEECVAHGDYDFVKDILIKKINSLKVYGYKFNGYWRSMCSVQLYYRTNMELLNPEIREELFKTGGKIFTKVKDETPAKYNYEAEVTNSIVGDGCIIEGIVQNSILFRGVTVNKGAVVKNSIIMQGSIIEDNAILVNTILDKNVQVTQGKSLKGEDNWPIIVGRKAIV